VNEATGETDEFFLITPCRAEWMYRSDTLFQLPGREYCAIWSRTEFLDAGQGCGEVAVDVVRKAASVKDKFREYRLTIRTWPAVRELVSAREIIDATKRNVPLLGRTEVHDPQRRRRATVEYPIKTMNICEERQLFQVDTGPVIVPDLASTSPRMIEWLGVAFICYNAPDLAEFAVRGPASVLSDGKELCRVVNYSRVSRLSARNTILSVE
jgi:hypothetical protein